jgi:hypothetical protein
VSHLAFIRPTSPSPAVRPPKGDDWLHEPKWDGFRFQVIKDGSDVRLFSNSGADYSNRLPSYAQGLRRITDKLGNSRRRAVPDRPRGWHKLLAPPQMRTPWPEEELLMFLAVDDEP